jgi:hypothetical protein
VNQKNGCFGFELRFRLLHALADVPVDKRALGVREVELVVEVRPRLCDRGDVREQQTARWTFARSPPWTMVGGW